MASNTIPNGIVEYSIVILILSLCVLYKIIPIDLCMVVSNSLPAISAYSGVMYTNLTLPLLCVCTCVCVCRGRGRGRVSLC